MLAPEDRIKVIFTEGLKDIPSLELKSAMEYSLFNAGKFLRPKLVYATGAIFDAPIENLDVGASAVELIHTYSLIHDDLPAMDNADLRRGKPTLHKEHGEAMAILAGDALQTLAFEVIARYPAKLKPERRLQMLQVLSNASGATGMVGGQSLDITIMNDQTLSDDLLLTIYRLKTGALFSASIELGRLCSANDDEVDQRALKEFGDCIGLAFQIQDDILDMEVSSAQLGKSAGLDAKKMTYPKIHGIEAAKSKVDALYNEALEAINYIGSKAAPLRTLITQMLQRNM